jgi:hypothetical protein
MYYQPNGHQRVSACLALGDVYTTPLTDAVQVYARSAAWK